MLRSIMARGNNPAATASSAVTPASPTLSSISSVPDDDEGDFEDAVGGSESDAHHEEDHGKGNEGVDDKDETTEVEEPFPILGKGKDSKRNKGTPPTSVLNTPTKTGKRAGVSADAKVSPVSASADKEESPSPANKGGKLTMKQRKEAKRAAAEAAAAAAAAEAAAKAEEEAMAAAVATESEDPVTQHDEAGVEVKGDPTDEEEVPEGATTPTPGSPSPTISRTLPLSSPAKGSSSIFDNLPSSHDEPEGDADHHNGFGASFDLSRTNFRESSLPPPSADELLPAPKSNILRVNVHSDEESEGSEDGGSRHEREGLNGGLSSSGSPSTAATRSGMTGGGHHRKNLSLSSEPETPTTLTSVASHSHADPEQLVHYAPGMIAGGASSSIAGTVWRNSFADGTSNGSGESTKGKGKIVNGASVTGSKRSTRSKSVGDDHSSLGSASIYGDEEEKEGVGEAAGEDGDNDEGDGKKREATFLLQRLESQNSQNLSDPAAKRLSTEANHKIRESFIKIQQANKEQDGSIDWDFWGAVMSDYEYVASTKPRELSKAIQQGIPPALRGMTWQLMAASKDPELESIYSELLKLTSPHEKSIGRDLSRTFPKHEYFKDGDGIGQENLYNVVKAYSLYDEEVGYTQGLQFIVGPLLLNMPDEEAFCVLVRLMKSYDLRSHFTPNMPGLQLRLFQFDRLLEELLPGVFMHLLRQGIKSSMYASQWFLTLFGYRFPLELVCSVFDLVFAEGVEAIFRFSVAILRRSEKKICQLEFEELIEFLKNNLYEAYGPDPDDPSPHPLYNTTEFVREALQVKITPLMLDQFGEEWENLCRQQNAHTQEIEKLRRANQQLSLQVRQLEASLSQINIEHCDLVRQVVMSKLEREELEDELVKYKIAFADLSHQQASDQAGSNRRRESHVVVPSRTESRTESPSHGTDESG